VKITMFRAELGGCLWLVGQSGASVLVDGGTEASHARDVAPSLARAAKAGQAIDRICVSSPVIGRLDGIRKLLDDVVAWRVLEYQHEAGNKAFPRPDAPRPPVIRAAWLNSVHELVGNELESVKERLAVHAQLQSLGAGASTPSSEERTLAAIGESERLSKRLNQLAIPWNVEFEGGLIYPRAVSSALQLGGMLVHLLGPSPEELRRSRAEWEQWLLNTREASTQLLARAGLDALSPAVQASDEAQDSLLQLAAELRLKRTDLPGFPPLLLLFTESDTSMLMTSDAAIDRVLGALATHGWLNAEGKAHVSALQFPVHAASLTTLREFFSRVSADHYLFASCGAGGQPSVDSVEALLMARLSESGPRKDAPFTLWFANSVEGASPESRPHLQQLEAVVRAASTRSGGRMRYRFLSQGHCLEVALSGDPPKADTAVSPGRRRRGGRKSLTRAGVKRRQG
jgi:hypothetical protein